MCSPAVPAAAQLLHPSDLTYEGVIAPPRITGATPKFAAGLLGLEYDPTCGGNPDPSPADGYPGCLVGTSHVDYDMIAMFDIPAPQVVTKGDYAAVPKGFLEVDFFKCSMRSDGADIQSLLDAEPAWDARDIPGVARSEAGDWICTCGHDWYDVQDTDYDSLCWFDFDPNAVNAQGAYGFGSAGDPAFHSQRMADYLGSIPQAWANTHLGAAGEPYCFSGMQRKGGGCPECSAGPTIYAFPCSRPAASAPGPLMTAQELLGFPNVYPIQVLDKPHPDYSPRSQARGAVWIDQAVVISAEKGGDYWWYGQADPWTDPAAHRNTCTFDLGNPTACFLDYGPALPPGTQDNCRTSKGYHSVLSPNGSGGPQYAATIQFYDANELAQVAAGQRTPQSVLPYATLEAPSYLWDTNCSDPGDLAYDPVERKLYWVEHAFDPLIHVYSVNIPVSGNESFLLSAEKTGYGTVTSMAPGIDCGADCAELFLEGSSIDLTATPHVDSTFESWSGPADCLDGEVTLDAARTCQANFGCLVGSELGLSNTTVTASETHEHCNRIRAGPAFTVASSGSLTLSSSSIVLEDGTQVAEGASLTIISSP